MTNKSMFFSDNIKIYLLIVSLSVVMLSLLSANPGYFSHDELQRYDHVIRYGFVDYFDSYVRLYQSDTFGTPVRPFSFFIQGLLSLFMENYPVIVHLFAVLIHATVACFLFTLALQFGASTSFSLTMSLTFVINPLAMFAIGWSAALMDQWYVLFGLLTLMYADRYVRAEQRTYHLFLVLLFSTLAMLSKETALVLPGLMIVIWFAKPDLLKTKRYWLALAVWVTPVFLFMLYRLPALLNSFGNPTVSPYAASLTNIPDNLLVYLAYPFIYILTEAVTWSLINPLWLWFGLALHLCIIIGIARIYRYKAALIYCFLYLLFLAPVLLISTKGAHYLYGSSIALSFGITVLLHQKWSGHFGSKLIGISTLGLLIVHSIVIQHHIYNIGTCMNRAMTSTEALYLSRDYPKVIDFQVEPGAPEHVLRRMITGREQVGKWYPVKLKVSKWGEKRIESSLNLTMGTKCIVHL
jgi:hypothetical protein